MKVDDLLDVLGEINPMYIEEAEQKRQQRKNRYYRIPAAACAALLLLGSIYGMWRWSADGADTFGLNQTETIAGTAKDAPSRQEGAAKASAEEASAAVWHINEVKELMYTVSCGAEPAQRKYYTAEELQAYYGIQILPDELPKGYELADSDRLYEIGYDTVSNVVADNCTIVYENPQTGDRIWISARTVDSGECVSFASDGLRQSVVCDSAVTAVHYSADSSALADMEGYLAVYKKEGVTVTVKTSGASEEVFCAVTENLLSGKNEGITVIHEPYKLLE